MLRLLILFVIFLTSFILYYLVGDFTIVLFLAGIFSILLMGAL